MLLHHTFTNDDISSDQYNERLYSIVNREYSVSTPPSMSSTFTPFIPSTPDTDADTMTTPPVNSRKTDLSFAVPRNPPSNHLYTPNDNNNNDDNIGAEGRYGVTTDDDVGMKGNDRDASSNLSTSIPLIHKRSRSNSDAFIEESEYNTRASIVRRNRSTVQQQHATINHLNSYRYAQIHQQQHQRLRQQPSASETHQSVVAESLRVNHSSLHPPQPQLHTPAQQQHHHHHPQHTLTLAASPRMQMRTLSNNTGNKNATINVTTTTTPHIISQSPLLPSRILKRLCVEEQPTIETRMPSSTLIPPSAAHNLHNTGTSNRSISHPPSFCMPSSHRSTKTFADLAEQYHAHNSSTSSSLWELFNIDTNNHNHGVLTSPTLLSTSYVQSAPLQSTSDNAGIDIHAATHLHDQQQPAVTRSFEEPVHTQNLTSNYAGKRCIGYSTTHDSNMFATAIHDSAHMFPVEESEEQNAVDADIPYNQDPNQRSRTASPRTVLSYHFEHGERGKQIRGTGYSYNHTSSTSPPSTQTSSIPPLVNPHLSAGASPPATASLSPAFLPSHLHGRDHHHRPSAPTSTPVYGIMTRRISPNRPAYRTISSPTHSDAAMSRTPTSSLHESLLCQFTGPHEASISLASPHSHGDGAFQTMLPEKHPENQHNVQSSMSDAAVLDDTMVDSISSNLTRVSFVGTGAAAAPTLMSPFDTQTTSEETVSGMELLSTSSRSSSKFPSPTKSFSFSPSTRVKSHSRRLSVDQSLAMSPAIQLHALQPADAQATAPHQSHITSSISLTSMNHATLLSNDMPVLNRRASDPAVCLHKLRSCDSQLQKIDGTDTSQYNDLQTSQHVDIERTQGQIQRQRS